MFQGLGEEKLNGILESKLVGMAQHDEIILQVRFLFYEILLEKIQTLYIIVNILTGNEKHKDFIMRNDAILTKILEYMVSFLN